MTPDALDQRDGLPDALRILLATHPRDNWQAQPDFNGLVSFWLERHMMFRQLMAHMARETEAFLDGDRAAQGYAEGLAKYGGLFVNQLHGHHQIEDEHYFPLLRRKDPRIEHGFDLLDADHHALDGILNRFVEQANGAVQGVGAVDPKVPVARFRDGLKEVERLIGRHLEDEEDLIVPVILTHGADGVG